MDCRPDSFHDPIFLILHRLPRCLLTVHLSARFPCLSSTSKDRSEHSFIKVESRQEEVSNQILKEYPPGKSYSGILLLLFWIGISGRTLLAVIYPTTASSSISRSISGSMKPSFPTESIVIVTAGGACPCGSAFHISRAPVPKVSEKARSTILPTS
jgi:hypothetical protein